MRRGSRASDAAPRKQIRGETEIGKKARAISKTQCWLPARAPTAEYPTTNAVDSDQNGPPQWSTSVHIHQYEAAFVDILPIP